jgi:mannose-6-phosphate isomerase-like protein (cupin superfamily)
MAIGFARLNIDMPHFNDVGTSINKKWLPHYNTQGYEGRWDVLTLRSPGGDTDNINAELLGNEAYADTPNMEAFPLVKKLIDSLQCEVMTVRLLNLKAGAVIKQHRDFELAFEKGEARLHFPIVTNKAVEFYVNDLRVSMQPGECWYINANLPHRVANYGSTDRIHLVVDCKVNSWLKNIFKKAEKTEFKEPVNREQTLQVIQALRMQQTNTANSLADKLELKLKNANLI